MFWFTPDGNDDESQNFNDGDVPTWDAATKRWKAAPGGSGSAQTWGETLVEGNESDGSSVIMTDGDDIVFEGALGIIQGTLSLNINGGDVVGGPGGIIELTGGDSDDDQAGEVNLNGGNSTSGAGGAIQLNAGNSDASDGGTVTIQGGTGAPGGEVNITAGPAVAADIAGANVNITAGTGTGELGNGGTVNIAGGNEDGTVSINQFDGSPAIVVSGDGLVDPAITVSSSGLRFWGGVAAIAPSITGVSADPVVLSLLAALSGMGLVTDDT